MLPFSKPAYLSISHHRSTEAAASTYSGFTSFYFSSLVCFALNFEIWSWFGKCAVWGEVVKRKAKGQTCWTLWAFRQAEWNWWRRFCVVLGSRVPLLVMFAVGRLPWSLKGFMTLCFCPRNWIMCSLWPICASTWAMTGSRDVWLWSGLIKWQVMTYGLRVELLHFSSQGFSETVAAVKCTLSVFYGSPDRHMKNTFWWSVF